MSRLSSFRRPGLLCAVLALSSLAPAGAQTLAASQEVRTALGRLEAAAGAPVKSTVSPDTGLVTFLAMESRSPLAVADARDSSPEAIALAFLETHGSVFGLASTATEVELARPSQRDALGMDHVRFRQVVRGVPVTAGELIVHLRGSDVVAVNAETLPNADAVNTDPTVSTESALEMARTLLSSRLHRDDAELSEPRLEILNRGLLEGRRKTSHLAWFIEAKAFELRQYIWVDAHTGNLLLHFSQLTDAKNRLIYNGNNAAALPGTLMRTEGQAATADAEADRAYDYSGHTYDYYFTQHGRDSFDGAGGALKSTVHHCPSGKPCPYENAFWDGVQMVYGEGYAAADDVVAHELTHAVTEHTAGLFYYMQSGALNESFSDMFGETVDLTNVGGADTAAVRWRMGEDLPGGGAFRNMSNPGLFGHPGRVNDPNYYCDSGDNGGVHLNSGVPNHFYALLSDGGTYNSVTVTGIGLTKAGKIAYRALTEYLVTGSGFVDAANAFQQSCTDLVGTSGITAGDCTQVASAIAAVEMAHPFLCTGDPATGPALCPAGQAESSIFFDDFETGTSNPNWSTSSVGANAWYVSQEFAASALWSLWGYDYFEITDSRIQMNNNVAIPSRARMQFRHSWDFDPPAYDGGVVEYSVNNGANWFDASSFISQGPGYTGTITPGYGNPLSGRSAFVGSSQGYTATQLNLASLAGQNVRFRFRIGTDDLFDWWGWYVDDVRIYQCPCLYSLASPMGFVGAGGGSGTLEVVTEAGCSWSASTSTPWLSLSNIGVGNKATFTALPNTTGSPRSGTITAAGQTFTVYQGAATDFYTITPCRVFNTSSTTPLVGGTARSFAVAGTCGIPATAKAITATVTALGSLANGNLTFYPGGVSRPTASTINFAAGTVRANNAILLLAPDGAGTIQVYPFVAGGGTVNAILDVTGYFE